MIGRDPGVGDAKQADIHPYTHRRGDEILSRFLHTPSAAWRLRLALALLVGCALLGSGCGRKSGASDGQACASNLRALGQCVETYAREHGGAPPARLADALASTRMTAVPPCPSTGTDTYSDSYKIEGRAFTLRCSTHHAGSTGAQGTTVAIDPGFPLYDSRVGVVLTEADYRERLATGPSSAAAGLSSPAAISSSRPASAPLSMPGPSASPTY